MPREMGDNTRFNGTETTSQTSRRQCGWVRDGSAA
jgi:hypothetical protein